MRSEADTNQFVCLFVFFTNARKRLPKMHEDLNGCKSIGHKYSGAVCDL